MPMRFSQADESNSGKGSHDQARSKCFKMVSRITAAAMFLGAALTGSPAFAEPMTPPPLPPLVVEIGTEAKPEGIPAKGASSDMDKIDLDYATGYLTDTGKILTSPLRWQAKEWMKAGLVVGGTTSLFFADKAVKEFAQKNRSGVASPFASVGNFIGDPMYVFPSVGAFYLYGYLADDSKVRRASLLALESLTISGAFTSVIKMVARRHRPNTGDPPTDWHGPTLGGKYVSFSSGHTSSAFAVATVIAAEYEDTPYVAPVAYGLATLTALSRIYSNEHWSSDVFFGAAVGYLVSKAVLSYHKDDKDKLGNRLTLLPQVGKEMTGLTVNYKF